MTWHQSMGHKGPVLRSRCIGTKRAQTQLLLYSTLMLIFYNTKNHTNYSFSCWCDDKYLPNSQSGFFLGYITVTKCPHSGGRKWYGSGADTTNDEPLESDNCLRNAFSASFKFRHTLPTNKAYRSVTFEFRCTIDRASTLITVFRHLKLSGNINKTRTDYKRV